MEMKKERLVISLIVMVVLLFAFAINVHAADPITPTRTGDNTTNSASSNESVRPSNSAISVGGGTGASANRNQASSQQLTPTNNTNNTQAAGSSYRNIAANTSSGDLPYTGSNYGMFFVIVALVVSAVYAYKKVSDYNM